MKGLSIRVRLTLWYGGLLAVTLVGFGVAVYLMLGHALMERLDESLQGEFHEMEEHLEAGNAVQHVSGKHGDHHESYLVRLTDPAGKIRTQSSMLGDKRLPVPQTLAGNTDRVYHIESISGLGPHRTLSGKGTAETVIQAANSAIADVITNQFKKADLQRLTEGVLPP